MREGPSAPNSSHAAKYLRPTDAWLGAYLGGVRLDSFREHARRRAGHEGHLSVRRRRGDRLAFVLIAV